MCPSTEPAGDDDRFATEVLRKLLLRIANDHSMGHAPYQVSHAWTEGPMIRVIYSAPPSDRTWGLARDTRVSVIDAGPWPDVDEAARYYFLIDFEENQPSSSPAGLDDSDTIWWFGHPLDGLPQRLSDVPESRRVTFADSQISATDSQNIRPEQEPRRYADLPSDS